LNSFHFFSSCSNHFLNELLGAISFCHKSTFTLSLLKPRGQSQSTNILKLLFPLGLLYILSIFIIDGLDLPLKLFHLFCIKGLSKVLCIPSYFCLGGIKPHIRFLQTIMNCKEKVGLLKYGSYLQGAGSG
jgi:hypothetical protein